MKYTMGFDGSQPCAQSDPEAWFPENGAINMANHVARILCREQCPFTEPCLEMSLTISPLPDGIWGGMTVTERERLRRQRRRGAA